MTRNRPQLLDQASVSPWEDEVVKAEGQQCCTGMVVRELWGQAAGLQISALPLTSPVTLGQSHNLPELWFL